MKKTSFLLAVLLMVCLITDGCSPKASAGSQNFGGNETLSQAEASGDEAPNSGDNETLSQAQTSGDETLNSGGKETLGQADTSGNETQNSGGSETLSQADTSADETQNSGGSETLSQAQTSDDETLNSNSSETLSQADTSGDETQNSGGSETLNKADTSEMDFTVDGGDASTASPAEGETVDLSALSSDIYSITSGGSYTLSGSGTDTMILVDAGKADVTLVLNGVTLQNSNGPAVYVRSADNVTLSLADGTTNTISDGDSYSVSDQDSALDGAIFSKADLTVSGGGTLILNGNNKHGIVSKDDLVIASGTLAVTAKNVGLCGKDCVKIGNAGITITAGSDGIRSDNEEDPARGYVSLSGGSLNITAGNDGIQAETVINAENTDLTISAGGGSDRTLTSADESYKGLKAGSDIYITGGVFRIASRDDCIHSNGTITISGGDYTLSSGDDGIHADTDLEISGSSTKIAVEKSYEGIEAANLYIKGGTVSVKADDDGLNAAGGNNAQTGNNGGMMRPGRGGFSFSTGSITISGGNIYIQMGGDGVDSNGSLTMTGGTVIVSGATSGDTSILDYDSTGIITGGTFIGLGASGMAQNFSGESTQGAILSAVGTQSAGTVVKLTDSEGNVLIEHTADRSFSCVILSHPSLKQGETYTLTAGSSSTTIQMTGTVYSSGGGGFGRGGFGGGGGFNHGGRR